MKGKIFRLINSNQLKIEPYNDEYDYYEFIKNERKKGYQQFIITSEYMIKLLEVYFLIRKFRIIDISFIEEDASLIEDIEYFLNKLKKEEHSSDNFNILKKQLMVLNDEESIDIKKIVIQGRTLDCFDKETQITIMVNGVIFIDNESFFSEADYLITNLRMLRE